MLFVGHHVCILIRKHFDLLLLYITSVRGLGVEPPIFSRPTKTLNITVGVRGYSTPVPLVSPRTSAFFREFKHCIAARTTKCQSFFVYALSHALSDLILSVN